MSKSLFLDKVIRKVNEKTKPQFNTEEVVIIDKKTGNSIPKKPLFGGNFGFYLVSNNDDPNNIAEREGLICKIKDFSSDLEIELNINYRVSCDPTYEKKVAEALHSEDSLENEMDKKVHRWIAKFTQKNTTDFINNCITLIPELTEYVKFEIEKEVGVNINLKVTLDKAEQLKPIPIPSIQFPVFVKDCDEKLKLSLGTELVVNESNKIKAILNQDRELLLENKVKEEVNNYLIQNITLHRFCYELKDAVRDELIGHLNKNLYDYGRQLKYLFLESDSVSPGQELLDNRSYEVKCTVEGYPEPILVKSRLYMQPLDIGKYRLANSPDLEYWAEEKLKSIVQPLLLQKEYIDVLLDFQPIAEVIKTKMNQAASEIGYQITHLVSKPNLEALKLLENFYLETEDAFSTRDAKVQIKLNTCVTAKIANLADIKDYLYQQVDVKGLMKNSIYNAARQYLNQIEPERFYMRFDRHDEELGENKSVEQELIEKIKQELEERFSAQVSIVVPKTLDTEISKCYKQLNSKIGFFEFEIHSLRGGEAVPYGGDFQVQAVEKNSWHIFQCRQPSLDDIKRSIERSLNAMLPTFGNEDLQYVDFDNRFDIENFINEIARNNVIDQFGLEISISNVSRERTGLEQSRADAKKELEQEEVEGIRESIRAGGKKLKNMFEGILSEKHNNILEELKKLYDQRLKLELCGDDDSNEKELEDLDKQIANLEQEIPNPSLEKARNSLDRLEPKRTTVKGFREVSKFFREVATKINLPRSETNPELDSSESTNTLNQEEDNNI